MFTILRGVESQLSDKMSKHNKQSVTVLKLFINKCHWKFHHSHLLLRNFNSNEVLYSSTQYLWLLTVPIILIFANWIWPSLPSNSSSTLPVSKRVFLSDQTSLSQCCLWRWGSSYSIFCIAHWHVHACSKSPCAAVDLLMMLCCPCEGLLNTNDCWFSDMRATCLPLISCEGVRGVVSSLS